jgi:DNA-binding transcriptional ArsR family regulator
MIDQFTAMELADTFRLMADASRLRIILACMAGPIPAGEIARALDLSPSLVSHHLRLLKAARILRGHRRGKQILYSVLDHHIDRVIRDMIDHISETDKD